MVVVVVVVTAAVCSSCNRQFTGYSPTEVARVSHHCRSCGKIVCETCSDNKMSLPHLGIGRRCRVCNHCAIWISG